MSNLLRDRIRECISSQFTQKVTKSKSEFSVVNIEYNNDPNDRFKGIFSHLGGGKPKSVTENQIVDVTALSFNDQSLHPNNVVDSDSIDSYFYSSDSNSWVCFDFKNRKVKPTHYSIRSFKHGDAGWFHTQNWCIEGSNDKNNWKLLDNRVNDKSIDGRSASNTFKISNQLESDDFYRYLRIRQTGVNTHNENEFRFSAIDFFGSILESNI